MTVEEKNELCKKGNKCLGCHRIFVDKVPTGAVKWEFELPDKVEEKPEPIKEIPKEKEVSIILPIKKRPGRPPKGSKGAK